MSMSQLTQEKTGSESHLESQIHGNKYPTTLAQIEETAFEDLNIESLLSPEEIRKLKWKIDARVLLPCFILYFLNTLDRATLGSAATFGFRTDNHLVGNQYNIGVSIFFLFYALSTIPSNLILKGVQAKIWLPVLALGYGAISLGTTWIHSYGSFIAVRIVLAISEAGTLPGVMFFLSLWYSRDELSFRIPFGLAASATANGVAPFLTNAYVKMGPITSAIHSWRSAFFVNAIVTLGFAVIAFFWLPWDRRRTAF
ncbi:MFS general substrate transporter [Meredithblackwellia eburnea MCA 4105]